MYLWWYIQIPMKYIYEYIFHLGILESPSMLVWTMAPRCPGLNHGSLWMVPSMATWTLPMWLRILRWREHPASSRWALNITTNILTFVRKLKKIQPQKRRQPDHRGEVRVMQWPCKQQKAKRRAKDSSHTVKEMKTSPCLSHAMWLSASWLGLFALKLE